MPAALPKKNPTTGARHSTDREVSKVRLDPIAEVRLLWQDQGWSEAVDGMSAVTSIVRTNRILIVRIDRALAPFNLTFARWELLSLLYVSKASSLSLGWMSKQLQVQPGAITNSVNRLEADGLVDRTAHPTDGRTTMAVLTRAGKKLTRTTTETLNREVFTALAISDAQARQLFLLMRTLRLGEGDFDPEAR